MVARPSNAACAPAPLVKRIEDQLRRGEEVLETGRQRLGIEHHMELRGDDQDADAGQHAVDHGRRHHAEPHAQDPSAPAATWIRPAISTTGPSAMMPCVCTSSNTSTASPAAGPLTSSGLNRRSLPTTMPPMIPEIRPAAGGTPEAIAMPMHSGTATRKTTIEARKSAITPPLAVLDGAALVPHSDGSQSRYRRSGARHPCRSAPAREAARSAAVGCLATGGTSDASMRLRLSSLDLRRSRKRRGARHRRRGYRRFRCRRPSRACRSCRLHARRAATDGWVRR